MKRFALIALAACGSSPAPKPVVAAPVVVEPPPIAKEPPMPTEPNYTQTAVPQDLTFPSDAFRKDQPPATALRPFVFPKMKPFTLANGITAYLVEQHTLPIVSMQLEFDGGEIAEPKGKHGLASVCMSMLTEGTEKLDKIQYAEALADIASSVTASASDDALSLSLGSLTKHLDETFALFVATLRTPGLRASDFDRMIKRRIESVKQARGNPTQIAGRVTPAVLYGATHPLGGVVTEDSLKAITLDDCRHYLATWLEPKHARLYVVGDLTEKQIREHFEGPQLAGWTGAGGKRPALPAPKSMAGRIFFVNAPKAAQSQVWMMMFGPSRTAKDYFSNTVMSTIFGGGFASRINMNLREDKGYAYGARGGFSYSHDYGTFTSSASVRTDSSYQSLLEMVREVKELASGKTPATADEIEREKTGAILALPGRFATAQSALGQYRTLVYFGLPLDYYDSYVTRVNGVTAAQVKASAEAHLRPDQAVYLVVGDGDAEMKMHVDDAPTNAPPEEKDRPLLKDGKPVTLREALADLAKSGALGKGGLVEIDADGKPVP